MTVRPTAPRSSAATRSRSTDFQLEAIDALDAGRHVVVAAPTGQRQDGRRRVRHRDDAGATGGGRSTRRRSRRCRTRSSATSRARYGAGEVGLLTGDNAIDGDAPVVVMTTEVLRNMIYAGSRGARRPRARRARRGALPPGHLPRPGVGGGHHPPARRTSAGVPVGDGEQHRRAGGVDRDRARPDDGGRRDRAGRSASTTATSSATARTTGCTSCRRSSTAARTPTRSRLDASGRAHAGRPSGPTTGAGQRPARARTRRGGWRRSSCSTSARLLPAILFIFSRNQCDEAARACLAAGLRLTDAAPSATAIREIVDARLGRSRRRRPRGARLRPVRSPSSRPASPPTTPGWCRRSRRPSRRASSRA